MLEPSTPASSGGLLTGVSSFEAGVSSFEAGVSSFEKKEVEGVCV